MNYVIQAALSNTQHPECGQVTISFPIPVDQYNKMLQAIDLDFSVNRDCKVDEINSRYRVLNSIQGTLVNVDNLDYLAKRLDGFCSGEVSQFEAMAHKLKLSDVKDFIDLTFCCQQVTIITDFSDLETVGRNYFMALNRDIFGAEGENPEHLNLPASEHQIEQTLLRIGIAAPRDAQVCVVWNELVENLDQFEFIPDIRRQRPQKKQIRIQAIKQNSREWEIKEGSV